MVSGLYPIKPRRRERLVLGFLEEWVKKTRHISAVLISRANILCKAHRGVCIFYDFLPCFAETGFLYVAQVGLEHTVKPRLASNSH